MSRLLLACIFLSMPAVAQEWNTTIPKDLIILRSTKDYQTALQVARQASGKLGKSVKLSGYRPHAESGLSLSRKDCEGDGYDYPCYNARGNGAAENSDYISIEFSDAYEGLAKGYYIVVAGVSPPGSPESKRLVGTVRRWYPDAYARRTEVWLGCMH